MIGNKDKFISLTTINGGKMTFGDNDNGKVICKHNLLSISQFCDKGKKVIFITSQCLVIDQAKYTNKLLKRFDI